MTSSKVAPEAGAETFAPPVANVYAEGLLAGLAGGVAVALWFFVLDVLKGRPLYTPMVLGTALFGSAEQLADQPSLPINFETVLGFTWFHLLTFLVIGFLASQLLALAERAADIGFGAVLLFVLIEAGFLITCMAIAEPVLHAIAWPAVLVGNLLAAAAMAGVFWRRHRGLRIEP